MVDAGLRREQLKDMASNPRLQLRKGVDEFLRAAHGQSVPVHIFSAGLYDVIHAYLELQGLDKYGAHVVSNMMEFEPDGRLLGFKGNLIHTLNKNSRAMRSSPGWERVEVRRLVEIGLEIEERASKRGSLTVIFLYLVDLKTFW